MVSLQTLTHWTAAGSFLLYVITPVLWLRPQMPEFRSRVARLLWTASFLLLLLHVGLAFQVFHHWSHRAAYEDTARQTAELTGLQWGGGIYANYALLLVWLVDVIWWWRGIAIYDSRPKWVAWCIQGFLAFMWFNATVVFGHGWVRYLGIAGFLIMGWAWLGLRSQGQKQNRFH